MRGELSEALDRLARRDEALRRRAASEDPASAAEDLVAAARRLVDRHPDLTVTVTIERGETRSSVRLAHGQPPYVSEPPYSEPSYSSPSHSGPSYSEGAPTAGVRPVDLAADEAVVLDSSRQPATAAARLAELLREYPSE